MLIQIAGLTKIYGKTIFALNEINMDIGNGMFGLLGPNGAGKTTLMQILVTLMKPSAGKVSVDDFDLQKHRREIRAMMGYLPQEFTMFSKLKTWEFLDYIGRLAGLKDGRKRQDAVEKMLNHVGLFEFRDRMTGKLSGGMKRRLGIAQALVGDPKIIVVDEPTTGLDPEERIRFRNLLAELSEDERIIILSTHIVGDISSSCTRMALLHRGRLVFNDAPEKLVAKTRGHAWQIHAIESELEQIKEKYPVISTMPSETGYEVQVVADRIDDFEAEPIEPNLEHAYVYFMEYEADGEEKIE